MCVKIMTQLLLLELFWLQDQLSLPHSLLQVVCAAQQPGEHRYSRVSNTLMNGFIQSLPVIATLALCRGWNVFVKFVLPNSRSLLSKTLMWVHLTGRRQRKQSCLLWASWSFTHLYCGFCWDLFLFFFEGYGGHRSSFTLLMHRLVPCSRHHWRLCLLPFLGSWCHRLKYSMALDTVATEVDTVSLISSLPLVIDKKRLAFIPNLMAYTQTSI